MIFPLRVYSFSAKKSEQKEILTSADLSNTIDFSQLFTKSLKHDKNIECSFIKTTLIICDLEELQPDCEWFISVWNRLYGDSPKLDEKAILKLIDLWYKNDTNYTIIIIKYKTGQDQHTILNKLKKYRTISLLDTDIIEQNNLEGIMNWCRLSSMTPYSRNLPNYF